MHRLLLRASAFVSRRSSLLSGRTYTTAAPKIPTWAPKIPKTPTAKAGSQTPKGAKAIERGFFAEAGFEQLGGWIVPGIAVAAGGVATWFVAVVPAGHIGVLDTFGSVSDTTRPSGLAIKLPWAKMRKMSVQTQKLDVQTQVQSKEGMNVGFTVTVLYRLDPAKAIELYRTVGPGYEDVLITANLSSCLRTATSCRNVSALYSEGREEVRAHVLALLREELSPRGIIIEDVPLRSVALPKNLTNAIELKLKVEQESQQMSFILQRERQEAERKAIEAKGIADFQKIVSEGIDHNLLKWKGIEATLELAKSHNAKVVVVGSGNDGLPLILGNN